MWNREWLSGVGLIGLAILLSVGNLAAAEPAARSITLVVMDPLAAPLACPCVEGYAQRKYEVLTAHLERELGKPVRLIFAESLSSVKPEELSGGQIDLVIGKDSVVRTDARALQLTVAPLARLTDRLGQTTQYGLVVVPRDDPAQGPADLTGYTIHFGPADCDEKHAAALALLREAKIAIPETLTTCASCSDGASRIVENGPQGKGAAVISSYAQPLLEGCGTIKKGDLRVIGRTRDVPFITAFAADSLTAAEQAAVTQALLQVGRHPEVCLALESLVGFLPIEKAAAAPTAQAPADGACWNGWRGPRRDGICPHLPATLAAQATEVWKARLPGSVLGGIAASDRYVVLGDRDSYNFHDVFRCYDAATGRPVWDFQSLAIGKLDYGNSPRATPCLTGDRAILLGGFGHLHCVSLTDGTLLWQRDLRAEFDCQAELPWGYCGSPLVVEDRVIVQAGGKEASLVALSVDDGRVLWQTPGAEPAYGSLTIGDIHGRRQILGHDAVSVGGWDLQTGERLWSLQPPYGGDFNVPTPLLVDQQLLVTTENNGTRLYNFDAAGRIVPEPVQYNGRLRPDMSSPVVVGNRLYCVCRFLFCLDLADGLKELYRQRDPALDDYASLIADDRRMLIIGKGELLLVDATTDEPRILSRQLFCANPVTIYSHPALVGDHLYLRTETDLLCLNLAAR